VVEEVRVEKRADKWDAFLKWSTQHHFEQFTTEQLAEQSGFSYQTTLKYLQESPTFRKIKKGLWEVRDAKADREAGI
jgi:ATP-dependent exoDNAse (exonuclease V) beta subunit